jgi:hypothetical protein
MARIYKTVYADVYAIHAKFGRVPPDKRDDKYWDEAYSAIDLYSKAHDDRFTASLLVAVAEELDREWAEWEATSKRNEAVSTAKSSACN